MARAAVRAKQAQAAQAQAAVKPRGKRKHASGGNPNQDLFFTRLRRRQKWVFLILAVLFAVSFVALGVGSGSGGGLEQVWNSILGSGSDPVGKANAEIRADPNNAKAYKDLANAYITQNNTASAISALQQYLKIKQKDSAGWSQLGLYESQQAQTALQQYQQLRQASDLEAPGSIVDPNGTLATQLGTTNPIDQYYSQQNQTQLNSLAQTVTGGYKVALFSFQKAAKYATRGNLADAELAVYSAAQQAGDTKAGLAALQRVVALEPNSPSISQYEAACKQLGGSCKPTHKKK